MKLSLLLLTVLIASSYSSRDRNDKRYRVVCYWGSWSFYNSFFRPEDANPNICTHLIYAFAKLNEDNTIGVFDTNLDIGDKDWNSGLPFGQGGYRRFNHLREYNPHLTTMIAIGGWNEGSNKYSNMVSSAANRRVFINSVMKFLEEHDFDGLDLDWEYPSMAAYGEEDRVPGNPADKENFVALCRELKEAFQPGGYILTAAVSAGVNTINSGYDVPQVTQYLDFLNMMTYDFHVGKENKTGHNAPLYPRAIDSEADQQLTVEYAVDHWIKLGASPQKLVLGMPLYSRAFYLGNSNDHHIGAAATGDGGMPTYNELCRQLYSSDYIIYRDEIQKVPFAVSPSRRLWVGFDDVQSLNEKLNFLKSKGLGGGMIWSIDSDDFGGACGNGKYPLLKLISRELNGIDGPDVVIPETGATAQPSSSGPTSAPSAQPPVPPVPPNPDGSFQCPGVGYFSDPHDRTKFHHCIEDGKGGYQGLVMNCPGGTYFDETVKGCVFE